MRISRVVIRNFRSFSLLDVPLLENTTCVIGENNTGKSNFLHAIRLCIDSGLSSTYRVLAPNDVHSAVDLKIANHVLIGLEITDFQDKINEEALVGSWQSGPGLARIFYRYRPKNAVRQDLESCEVEDGSLKSDDYHWELSGGGDPGYDLADIEWNDDVGSSVRFSDLQAFQVVFLPALRDVESDLRQYRASPLARLIDAMDIEESAKEALLDSLREANAKISGDTTVENIAKAVDESFKGVSGPAFAMDVDIGVAEPSFQAIVRALRILMTNVAMANFDPSSNGLGLNNILYVSILFEYFRKRVLQNKSAGQIILFEEPEAHLHPQLQLSLFSALNSLPFQSILTTHSTHITAYASLPSYVVLTQTGVPAISSSVPAESGHLSKGEVKDLERYLDATKSVLLYARKVMLVEGPAELFPIPALVRKVMGIDLGREGISVIPIYGVHFDVYAKLFGKDGLPKRCAIVADGDLKPSDGDEDIDGEDDIPPPPDLSELASDHVRVFACASTFERAVTLFGTLLMWAKAADDVGAPTVAKRLRDARQIYDKGGLDEDARKALLDPLRTSVLSTAKRFGKARFSQLAARHVTEATVLPKYITDAVNWLTEK
jgi:putative ATP-dependent endonuclease of the OLD family